MNVVIWKLRRYLISYSSADFVIVQYSLLKQGLTYQQQGVVPPETFLMNCLCQVPPLVSLSAPLSAPAAFAEASPGPVVAGAPS